MANLKPRQENLKNKGLGRPKGAQNKFTNLKDTFLNAFESIGGEKELAKWAKQERNRQAFYQMIAKMLPNKVEAEFERKGRCTVIFETVQKSDEAKVKQ